MCTASALYVHGSACLYLPHKLPSSPGFPHRTSTMPTCPTESISDAKMNQLPKQTDISSGERLDIESSSSSSNSLSSPNYIISEDDINKAPVGRQQKIQRVSQILNHPSLIGQFGVGKTAIVEGFAQQTTKGEVPETIEGKKVRLGHVLERNALICEAASIERPSAVTDSLFIGGALAARSVYTLQHLGITHILCLCINEIGQSDSQFPDLFAYKNFSVCDDVDSNISIIFDEACDFIDFVEQTGQRVLVHCFEGRSRSVTVVLAYLMLKKKFTLLEAWNALKRVHPRAQPNDGFARILQELDEKLHGKVSMEWQQRKSMMRTCPICGKNVGVSSRSLKFHLQKSHNKLPSGSVDSAMTMEPHSMIDE